tara:strand:+ start:199 stop:447 length:249 start_codon:yes stop_codon:yes gene_type:complete
MKSNRNLLLHAVIVGIVINLVLPFAVKPFATPEQVKPPNGAENLPFFDQLMHMFVHHAQVPLTSSIIVAVIVLLSVYVGQNL